MAQVARVCTETGPPGSRPPTRRDARLPGPLTGSTQAKLDKLSKGRFLALCARAAPCRGGELPETVEHTWHTMRAELEHLYIHMSLLGAYADDLRCLGRRRRSRCFRIQKTDDISDLPLCPGERISQGFGGSAGAVAGDSLETSQETLQLIKQSRRLLWPGLFECLDSLHDIARDLVENSFQVITRCPP